MTDRGCDGNGRDAEDTGEMLYSDLNDKSSVFGPDSSTLKLDYCDLLLDTIDAQLGQLQVQPQKHPLLAREHKDAARLRWSQSQDMGFGSITETSDIPISGLDLMQTLMVEKTSVPPTTTSTHSTVREENPISCEETKQTLDRRSRDKEEKESRREQIIWRLGRLLGDTCSRGRMAGESHSPSDSICTEDFVRSFRDEMVELSLPEGDIRQLDEEAERAGTSDWDSRQNEQQVLNGHGEVKTSGNNSKGTETAHYSHSHHPRQHEGLEECVLEVYPPCIDSVGAGERCITPERLGGDGSISHSAQVLTEHGPTRQKNRCSTKTRGSEGVPVWNLESVSTDSDLHSVCTKQLMQHFNPWPGHGPFCGNVQNRVSSGGKAQRNSKEKYRLVCSLGEKDTDEETSDWSRGCRPERTSEKIQSDWFKIKDRLYTLRQPGVVMSALERKEMDRQIDSAKTELFVEQRRAREKLESVQEKLEETLEELQRVKEAESSLRNKCTGLQEKQRQERDQIKAAEFQVGELQSEVAKCRIRQGTLERMLAQKEQQLLEIQETCEASQTERDKLRGELQHLKTLHTGSLKEAQEQAHRMIRQALKLQKKDLTLAHEQQIQTINKQTEEEKAYALKDQALSITRHIESLKSSIQLKEEEAKKIRDSLEQLKQDAKNRQEELHAESMERVKKAIEEERRRWELEKVEAAKVQCAMIEEQSRDKLESMRCEMQREKSRALALHQKVVELNTKLQELEKESCDQRREQESLLSAVCKSLKEEHKAELQSMQQQSAQDSQMKVLQLEQAVQLAEKEADRLQDLLEERESSHNRITADIEQQLQLWTKEIGTECHNLQLLVYQSRAKHGSSQLPPSPTAAEALTNLPTLREHLKDVTSCLQLELNSHTKMTEFLRNEKERELSIQSCQLRMERDQALNSLKERLILDHIEELSSLNWEHMCGGAADGGGVAASLRKQLKAKDLELRQVQQSMSQWKEQTAARLAYKFKEELTDELERRLSKTGEKSWRTSDRPGGQMTLSAKESQGTVCSPSIHVAASHSPSDVASLKLLHYLQSRVRQLRMENLAHTCSPLSSNKIPVDSSGSYQSTITQGQDITGIQSHSSARTVSS